MSGNDSSCQDETFHGNSPRKLTKTERDLAFKLKILAANINIAVQMFIDHREDVDWVLQRVRNSLQTVPGLISQETDETNAVMPIHEKNGDLLSQTVPKKKLQA